MACSRAGRKRYSSVALKNMVFRSRSASSMDIKRTMTKSERKQKKPRKVLPSSNCKIFVSLEGFPKRATRLLSWPALRLTTEARKNLAKNARYAETLTPLNSMAVLPTTPEMRQPTMVMGMSVNGAREITSCPVSVMESLRKTSTACGAKSLSLRQTFVDNSATINLTTGCKSRKYCPSRVCSSLTIS